MKTYKVLTVFSYDDSPARFAHVFETWEDAYEHYHGITIDDNAHLAFYSINWKRTEEDEKNGRFYFNLKTLEKISKEQCLASKSFDDGCVSF